MSEHELAALNHHIDTIFWMQLLMNMGFTFAWVAIFKRMP